MLTKCVGHRTSDKRVCIPCGLSVAQRPNWISFNNKLPSMESHNTVSHYNQSSVQWAIPYTWKPELLEASAGSVCPTGRRFGKIGDMLEAECVGLRLSLEHKAVCCGGGRPRCRRNEKSLWI
uniref:Uncharacterized protein n=1 Tax=Knipowitschia caucasica TaxID=637954 RepID=A0AAV2L4L9_KNICA